jgi:hypothetical protein
MFVENVTLQHQEQNSYHQIRQAADNNKPIDTLILNPAI